MAYVLEGLAADLCTNPEDHAGLAASVPLAHANQLPLGRFLLYVVSTYFTPLTIDNC